MQKYKEIDYKYVGYILDYTFLFPVQKCRKQGLDQFKS